MAGSDYAIPSNEQGPEATVVLQVRVADAQGLRLMRGGETRLQISLRSIEDPEGELFGLKVTPWQEVPETHAPSWRPREAVFTVPAERCFSAEFVDSAHLHIALMQKGHALPPGKPAPGAPMAAGRGGGQVLGGAGAAGARASPPLGLGLGLAAALQGAVAAVQGVAAVPPLIDRGEVIGTLRLPLGRRLVCPDDSGGMEGAAWVQLIEPVDGGQKVKGSLLLELKTAHNHLTKPTQPSSPPFSAPTSPTGTLPPSTPTSPSGAAKAAPPSGASSLTAIGAGAPASEALPKTAEPSISSNVSTEVPAERAASEPGAPVASPAPSVEEVSDSASESGVESDVPTSQSSAPTSSFVTGDDASRAERPAIVERPLFLPSSDVTQGDGAGSSNGRSATQTVRWLASSKGPASDGYASDGYGYASDGYDSYESNSEVNIFTINQASSSSAFSSGAAAFGKLFRWGKRPSRLRSALDLGKGKHRRDTQKWRKWHEVFCALNEIEQRLAEVLGLLMQAAASMRQFGDSHTRLSDCARLSAFLCDAALYFKSEATVPRRLESHLSELERIADEFRRLSVDGSSGGDGVASGGDVSTLELDAAGNGATAGSGQSELWLACEDLQVDIAVLLESAQMTAQLALAEYQKMHCRLELLVTEYAPICRLELDDAQRPTAFLPLLTSESSVQVTAASVPERALEWALDFAQLVGNSSQGLEKLVRELDQRTRQLKACAKELKAETLRRAASGQIES